ncbi:MAG: hypothetical protein QOI66_4809 [Myxococcales bacterium]|jgi:hypothetical protein|nr:hypothetical protein [Myxococcales bacterium]
MSLADSLAMNWRQRLRDLLLAGGTVASVGYGATGCLPIFPCGNANNDPCICGRPDQSAQLKAECDEKTQCVEKGGQWKTYFPPDGGGMSDGSVCVLPDDAGSDQGGDTRSDAGEVR